MLFNIRNIKRILFITSLFPLSRLGWLAWQNQLGANPVEFVIHSLGSWTLIFLLLTLAMTPLRNITNANWPLQLRRMLGLYTFFFGSLHLLAYAGLDLWFDWIAILNDVSKHPYVMLGFASFLMMLPLAVTSNKSSMRFLGRRWKLLHRLVYPAALCAVLHFLWLVKKDMTEPLIYTSLLLFLLALRSRTVLLTISHLRQRYGNAGGYQTDE